MKRRNGRGAKGCRKKDAGEDKMNGKKPAMSEPEVADLNKPEKPIWTKHGTGQDLTKTPRSSLPWAKSDIWTLPMLAALQKGVKGDKWPPEVAECLL
jgi:hypothetical protein